ncbi:MAG TPA: EAL domain-containing protein [Pseudonocardiaceae bacterium]|nr:EAL domain-containing protein [Pseudonocardiaceae bacterium]
MASPSNPGRPPTGVSGYPDDFGLPDRADVARRWATALTVATCAPLPRSELGDELRTLVDELLDACCADPFTATAGERVGHALVDVGCTTDESLPATITTLTQPLLAFAITCGIADPVARVAALTGAITAGYVTALRDWLFGQQENVKKAMLLAESKAEQDLYRQEEQLREMFNRAPVGIARADVDGTLIRVNPALREILGRDADELLGHRLDEFFHPEDASLMDSYQELFERRGDRFRRRRRLVGGDGTVSWVYLAVSALGEADGEPTGSLTIVENVSELHYLQEGMIQQALHDGLTNLPNRQYLLSRLQTVLGQPRGADASGVTLYHLDLDGFSVVNNGIGPAAGDRLLSTIARRLEDLFVVGSGDPDAEANEALVARIGGDEFAVLLPENPDDAAGQPDVLGTVNRINEELAEPVYLEEAGGIGVAVSACVGVAHGRTGETEPAELIRQADVTLRRARAIGKRQWSLYDVYRDHQDRERLTLAAALPGALEFGELTVAWQPWTSLADDSLGSLGGIAARLRWQHPERGLLGHAECLELAEETGAVLSLGGWLVRAAYAQAMRWRERFGARTPAVGVGLTVSQASDPDLVRTVRTALREYAAPPDAVWLGFPTPALRGVDGDARENLEVLVGMGVGVMLTDFGASASDLLFVDEWPIRAAEIGPWLVRQAEATPQALVTRLGPAVAGVLRELGCEIIVPDVASDKALARWRAGGVTAVCRRDTMSADQITADIAAMLADPTPAKPGEGPVAGPVAQ